jgi:hypothetical protein
VQADIEAACIPKHLQESIIYCLHRLLPVAQVAQANTHRQAVILSIQLPLTFPVCTPTASQQGRKQRRIVVGLRHGSRDLFTNSAKLRKGLPSRNKK